MMVDSPGRPVPAVTASAVACTVPDSAPRLTKLVPPLYTDAMRERHRGGVVDVLVFLESDGSIAKAVVARSAGDSLLDAATYAAAVASSYTPEVRGCTYLAGSYVFRARYKVDPVMASGHPTAPPIADEPPPFQPRPEMAPAPVPLPSDRDDVITTYSPSALGATPAPLPRAPQGIGSVTPLHPFHPIPIPGPTAVAGHPLQPTAVTTPAPATSPAPH